MNELPYHILFPATAVLPLSFQMIYLLAFTL